ncbi:MAG: 23S rRNA (guanosine(2251)-2'-O)-methyltransferase RlmB [Gammaproteobacteria bacterium]|nr:23S rRNA (guanosine(2251)-2'-O)-methyltransferase RlmB [Gammaproteobacteria bacterium]
MTRDAADPKRQIIAGMHSVRSALKHGDGAVRELWVEQGRRDRRINELVALAKEIGAQVHRVAPEVLETLAGGINHQGVAASSVVPAAGDEKALRSLLIGLREPPFLLILDGVQDPHNLGACLRSAEGAGVHGVIAPKDRSCGLSPTACKVASGAAELVPFFQVTNLARILDWLRRESGIWLLGTAGEAGTSFFGADLTGPLGIVMGGEEKGLRRLTRERCDSLAKLPMAGKIESLNIAVAAGICLYEAVRQRTAAGAG